MTRDKLQNIFRQPFSMQIWQELLMNLFGATEVRTTPTQIESDNKNVIKGEFIGELNTSDRFAIGLFSFEVNENTKIGINRVGLRKLVHSYAQYQYDAVIAVFYNDSQWRLSFICDLKDENTSPKRYTYVFGNETENYRTAADQLIKLYDGKPTFESIKDAFSVDKLSKEFFTAYKKQYDKFIGNIGDNKPNRDYVKKMMGRLVFLQFLQKKGWMGVPADQDGWHGGDLQYTRNLIKKYNGEEKLLTNVLEKLFFDTLNTKRTDDIADPKLGDNIKIPYLNGGLFDRDDLDKKDIDFPYDYFANLMEFFSNYNFTIDENDPYDAEVGIDPEMLGHIFENLLEDNKDKGAFYTPKEIVQYMCRQSLIEYLQSKLGKHESIATLINQHQVGDALNKSNFVAQNAAEISRLLDSVKICDPAIGSGAFPMGLLNEIFHTKLTLNNELNESRAEVKKNIIQNSIYGVDIEQGAVDIARLRFWLSLVVDEDIPQPLPNLDYKIMCGNSLLSRHALDTPITEVFAEYNKDKKKDEHFTLSDYKTLVAQYTNSSNKDEKASFRDKIEDIKRAFKTELDKSVITKRIKLQSEINNLKADTLFGAAPKESIKLAKDKEKTLKVMLQNEADITSNKLYENAFEWRFELPALLDEVGGFGGFDIVIGNPPYVDIKAIDDIYVKEYFKKFSTTTNRINLYSIFIEQGYNILSDKGVLCYINPNSMLVNSSYQKLREFIVSDLISIIKLPDNIFESATVETIIFTIAKNRYCDVIDGKYYLSNDCADLSNICFEKFDKSVWKSDKDIRFNIFTNSTTVSLLAKIESNSTTLMNVADFSLGITPYDKARGHSQPFIKSKGFHADTKLTDEYVQLIKGTNIEKFIVNGFSDSYLKYTTDLGAPRQKRFFTNEKVIVRQILSTNPLSLIAAYSNCEHFFTQIGFSIIPNDCTVFAVKYLLCLLNSKLINFYHLSKYLDSEKVIFPKILIESCKQFPIKIVDNQQSFIDIADQILEAKKENPTADTTALEAQIDQMVYALYNLTEEEIAIIENR